VKIRRHQAVEEYLEERARNYQCHSVSEVGNKILIKIFSACVIGNKGKETVRKRKYLSVSHLTRVRDSRVT